jgi:hypothetical protein
VTRVPRIVCFALGIAGGLVAGAGAMLTWRSLDLGGVTTTKGVDAAAGKVVLALAVASIVLTLFLRVKDTEEPRGRLVPFVLAAGLLIAAIGVLGVVAPDTALSSSKQQDAEKIAEATGSTPEKVIALMDKYSDESPGAGPVVTAVGGLMIVGGAVAGFAWGRAWRRQGEHAEPADDSEGPTPSGEPGEPA